MLTQLSHPGAPIYFFKIVVKFLVYSVTENNTVEGVSGPYLFNAT